MPIFTEAELTQICLNMLQSVGVLETEAGIVTKSMIDANLVGHDSHGIIHLPKYIQGIMDASIRLDAKVETEQAGAEREMDRSFFSNYKFEACLCDNQVNKQEQMFIHAVNDVFALKQGSGQCGQCGTVASPGPQLP